MVRDACKDTMSLLEVSMNETLGRTSKLVTALSRSMGPRKGESRPSLNLLPNLDVFQALPSKLCHKTQDATSTGLRDMRWYCECRYCDACAQPWSCYMIRLKCAAQIVQVYNHLP